MNYSNSPEGYFLAACHRCKTPMWLPAVLHDAARRSEKISFFCAYGHEAIFREGESDADKFRRERDMARQALAQRDDEIKRLHTDVGSLKTLVGKANASAVRARKRAAVGLCPHPDCHRSFASSQMMRHIRSKHPDYKAEEVA